MKSSITFERITFDDSDASPLDYLFQDEAYRTEDQERLDAFKRGEWHFIGIRCAATVTLANEQGTSATSYTLESAGRWGIESDSSESYLSEVFEDEKAMLIADIARLPEALAA